MVEVNGVRLIDRLLTQLSALPLDKVVIVTGYEGDKLQQYIGAEYKGLLVEYVHNPVYDKTNNIYSFALAREQLRYATHRIRPYIRGFVIPYGS